VTTSNLTDLYAELGAPGARLVRLLEGVKGSVNPTKQFLENVVDELNPNDPLGVWEMSGFLLDHREIIVCSLIGGRRN
jgi:hypothetical protein